MPTSFGRRPLLAALPAASVLAGVAPTVVQGQDNPLKRHEATFKIKDFKLQSGAVMPEVTIA